MRLFQQRDENTNSTVRIGTALEAAIMATACLPALQAPLLNYHQLIANKHVSMQANISLHDELVALSTSNHYPVPTEISTLCDLLAVPLNK